LKFTGKDIEGEDLDESDEEEGSVTREERRELDFEEKKEIDRWTSRAYVSPPTPTQSKRADTMTDQRSHHSKPDNF